MTQDKSSGRFASPACMASEIAPDYFDPLGVDPEQERDVARWRKAKRAELLANRRAMSVEAQSAMGAAIAGHLLSLLTTRLNGARGHVFSGYWPIKGEPDLRAVMADMDSAGVIVALPVVETRAAPLVFRRWRPGMTMVRGDWNIPVPPPDAAEVLPDIVLAPVMGWDVAGYRLGYGGGYFDRTLAALQPRPFSIGIGSDAARLATIFPQPHDIALDIIVTENGIHQKETES